ncbi:MAG TPA: flavin reductase family protein [Polyangiales bacterium]
MNELDSNPREERSTHRAYGPPMDNERTTDTREIRPAVHYWGTPVVLVSTLNDDGTLNIAPMSSAWWLGWSCMLGFDASSQTVSNLTHRREAVLNLTSARNASAVDRLALTTGARSVPLHKRLLGYRHEPDKLGCADFSTLPSLDVATPRLAECPVQLECVVRSLRPFAKDDPRMTVPACAVEVRIVRAHAHPDILRDDDHIDTMRWRPLLMSFRELFELGPALGRSRLAAGDDVSYAPWKRGPWQRAAASVLGAAAKRRYAVGDDEESP